MAVRKRWTARLDMQDVVVLRAHDATKIEEHFAVAGRVAASQVDHWFPDWHRDNGGSRVKLLDFCAALHVAPGAKTGHVETSWLKERVQAAFRRKELLAVPAVQHGAFRPLLPLITGNVQELPKSRGIYIAYRYDAPFHIGHARANLRACMLSHLPRRRHAFAKVPERVAQFDYYCPKVPQETVAEILRKLETAKYGDMRLEPDPLEPPAKCRNQGCQCLKYNDGNSQGAPKIRFVASMSAKCTCGHNYIEHE